MSRVMPIVAKLWYFMCVPIDVYLESQIFCRDA
jgi:hypothetical protein